MDSKETHQEQQQNTDAAALVGPISPLSLLQPQPQPQPQQPLMLEGSPHPVATQQQPSMEGGRQRTDVNDGGGENVRLTAKRGRGRPPGSVSKQRNPLGEGGGSFRTHVIDVNAGEDIAAKLVTFLNQVQRDACILSASGTVSRAWLQSDNPLGVVKYECPYSIKHMSGIFLNTESHDGIPTRTGNLIVTLAGPDFNIVGGCVRGMLVAGSRVKVIVGSFVRERVERSAASAPDNVLSLSGGGPGLPQSQGPQFSSEPSEEDGSEYSPLHQVGNSTSHPPPHLELWPGNNPQ